MNQAININTAAKKSNPFQNVAQSILDFVTLKALRDVLNMKLDFQLDAEDLREIDEQLWP